MFQITLDIDEGAAKKLAEIKTLQGLLDDVGRYCADGSTHDKFKEFQPAIVALHLLARSAIVKELHRSEREKQDMISRITGEHPDAHLARCFGRQLSDMSKSELMALVVYQDEQSTRIKH